MDNWDEIFSKKIKILKMNVNLRNEKLNKSN
jgi:hypothetical protein